MKFKRNVPVKQLGVIHKIYVMITRSCHLPFSSSTQSNVIHSPSQEKRHIFFFESCQIKQNHSFDRISFVTKSFQTLPSVLSNACIIIHDDSIHVPCPHPFPFQNLIKISSTFLSQPSQKKPKKQSWYLKKSVTKKKNKLKTQTQKPHHHLPLLKHLTASPRQRRLVPQIHTRRRSLPLATAPNPILHPRHRIGQIPSQIAHIHKRGGPITARAAAADDARAGKRGRDGADARAWGGGVVGVREGGFGREGWWAGGWGGRCGGWWWG